MTAHSPSSSMRAQPMSLFGPPSCSRHTKPKPRLGCSRPGGGTTLASLYESFIRPFFVLLAVPLALIGVFIAFVIVDIAFDSSAYIGLILLGGIAVNNSILLVDRIHLRKKQGISLLEAVLEGTKERIRPIFMTTGTTVLGMLPLVLFQAEEGRMGIWHTLALSTMGGLISSTIFILITVPMFYFHGEKTLLWTYDKIDELREAWKSFQ